MNLQSLRDEIERRVAEKLPAALFEKGLVIHAKHSFRRGCDCNYCIIKREATLCIARAPLRFSQSNDHVGPSRSCYATTEAYEFIKERREQIRKGLRLAYKAKMNDAVAGI